MLKIASKISLLIFVAALPFFYYGFGKQAAALGGKLSLTNPRLLAFAAGAGVFIPCLYIANRIFNSAWNYLETLEHELTHLIVGLFFLKIPVGFRVSAHEGGEVRHIGLGTTGKTWIALAPYFLPTVSIAVMIAAYFLNIEARVLSAVLGWTAAFHMVTTWRETSFRQPDLRNAGIVSSVAILPIMNLICYGAVVAYAVDGRKGFSGFLLGGIRESYEFMLYLVRRAPI
jgi:hypothetical protein